jgi:site-specific DNA recombinase
MIMQVAGYTRVSTEDQADSGISLAAQKDRVQGYAQAKGFELVEIIEDAGISAKDLNRPGIQRVLNLARQKEIQGVIVCKLDRMFRSTIDALETIQNFNKWGVGFYSIEETIDTKSPHGEFFLTILAAFGQMERKLIGERTRTALKHKRANGEKTGGDVPFGYSLAKDEKTLVEIPEEQKTIGFIKRLKAKGHSLRGIAEKLQRKGCLTKTGKTEWNPKTVKAILAR